ncbi:glutathione S-transferase N-terminal domain-containing protein [Phenylobacterium aquaticum]|uniref:glutathione S-transferase N-terminal domain-containing protein n=1 Tax=Phenylobacterium aquaticum TaxID=1763816 RepID=UPI001F5D2123|nr:glutathione S-transferase N-terminal domain-containing protein [Phenylobacterium aquaticum]MCI3134549.1 glutathione S-transferase N-terminal domain-containing protein [Phenylobacterium aquaticum]
MKLYYSNASPFARKVLVAAHELGLADRIELVTVTVTPTAASAEVVAANPLSKIPTLVTDDGQAIYDSRVIVDYLDTLTPRALAPRSGAERFAILTELAAADGLLDAALLARYEQMFRPEPLRWTDWAEGQLDKVRRTLDHFEGLTLKAEGEVGILEIAVACGLGYLDFRFASEDWRTSRPKLAAFYAAFSQRPAWPITDPAR